MSDQNKHNQSTQNFRGMGPMGRNTGSMEKAKDFKGTMKTLI